ncbi:hypothetical protein EPUL_006726, partial [Erysiphe pulchra]
LSTVDKTETFVQGIFWALESAIKAGGKHPNKQSGESASQRTSECRFAHIDYREAVDEVCTHYSSKDTQSNSLLSKKRALETKSGRCEILPSGRTRYYSQGLSFSTIFIVDDLPPYLFQREAGIPWSDDLTDIEVWTCIIGSGNTTPGYVSCTMYAG